MWDLPAEVESCQFDVYEIFQNGWLTRQGLDASRKFSNLAYMESLVSTYIMSRALFTARKFWFGVYGILLEYCLIMQVRFASQNFPILRVWDLAHRCLVKQVKTINYGLSYCGTFRNLKYVNLCPGALYSEDLFQKGVWSFLRCVENIHIDFVHMGKGLVVRNLSWFHGASKVSGSCLYRMTRNFTMGRKFQILRVWDLVERLPDHVGVL